MRPAARRTAARHGPLLALGLATVLLLAALAPGVPGAGARTARPILRGAASDPAAAPPARTAAPGARSAFVPPPAGVVSGFSGLNSSQPACGCAGTNVSYAVGPNDSLELVEGHAAWFSSGAALLRTLPLATFFGLPGDRLTGPTGSFDPYLGRFVVAASDATTGALEIGMSNSSNSTGAWSFYSLPAAAGDRLGTPTLGAGGAVLTVAAPAANESTGTVLGTQCWIVNGSALRNGATLERTTFGPVGVDPTTQAVGVVGSARSGLFVASGPAQLTITASSGVPPYPINVQSSTITVTPYSAPRPLAQPGTAAELAAPPAGAFGATDDAGILLLVRTVSDGGADGLQLIRANLSSGAVLVDRLVGAGQGLFDPAVASDGGGDVVIVAGLSNGTVDPSLVELGQPANEPGTLGPLTFVVAGAGVAGTACTPAHICAWGNGSSAAADPENPTGVWIAGTYVDGSGANWSTFIASANAPPLAAPLLTSEPPSIDLGQPVNFTVVASGGTGAYRFTWTGLPSGCAPANRSDLACRPVLPGSTTVRVNVTDAGGITVTAPSLPFTTQPTITLPIPLANRTSADTGQSTTFTVTPSGGLPPYSYDWTPPFGAVCGPGTGPTFNCTFTGNGSIGIAVTATDSNGLSARSALPYRVYARPQLGAIAVEPTELIVGLQMNLSVPLSGGTAPFLFVWTGLPAGCSGQSAGHLSCIPRSAGPSTIRVEVTDGNGLSANATVAVSVLPAASSGGGILPLDGILLAFAVLAGGALLAVFYPRARRGRGTPPPDTSMIYGGPLPRPREDPTSEEGSGTDPSARSAATSPRAAQQTF